MQSIMNKEIISLLVIIIIMNRPFTAYSHIVQKPPCWDARDALGQDKQRTYII